jgi:hypothetical protein
MNVSLISFVAGGVEDLGCPRPKTPTKRTGSTPAKAHGNKFSQNFERENNDGTAGTFVYDRLTLV